MSAADVDPFLRILSGAPTSAELAAVVMALLAVTRTPEPPAPADRTPGAVWSLPEGAARPEVSWTT
ncbi:MULTISPECIES: acyl-CoA carboxylase subunit epsilon [unclassified Streptomyces]|uniref:acyl-CoA carboxylase subunit epsilon n=1 Tax=unclassified Streptomyces TaxID=2593676 RepID=UPI0004BDD417|nr:MULTISPECIES: acyl-CoA carboxylase subunit epsilon [unclassified Streptomyces]